MIWQRRFFCCVLFYLVLVGSAVAETQRQLWVTNAYGDDVHIYEVGTWKLVKHLKVGPNPHGISVTADGRTVHIAIENFRSPQACRSSYNRKGGNKLLDPLGGAYSS